MQLSRQYNDKQVLLMWMAIVVIVCCLLVHNYIIPAHERLDSLHTSLKEHEARYQLLKRNIRFRDLVDAQFGQISGVVVQTKSDEITLSEFLREVESKARQPNMQIINMKPMPVKDEGICKKYGVRLSATGKLQEVLRFVTEITNDQLAVGLEAFSLRGVQGQHMVECTLSLWMIRLKAPPA